MKVSIIIPIYNVSDYIEQCLVSVFNQSYDDLEIILIDDATPDDSMLKVDRIIATNQIKNNILVLKHDKNQGLSAARNTGIKASHGEYLFFLDSDDVLPINAIEDLVKYTSDSPDFVISAYSILNSSKDIPVCLQLSDGQELSGMEILNSLCSKSWFGTAWNKLVHRRMFDEYACFFHEGILHEDIPWSFALSIKAKFVRVCSHITYLYRIRAGSITQKINSRNFDSLESAYIDMLSLIKDNHIALTPLLMEYLSDHRIYFYKELVRQHLGIEEISKRIRNVNKLFNGYNLPNFRYTIQTNLKLLAYLLPVRIGVFYVKCSL